MKPLIYAWPGHDALAAALAATLDGEVGALTVRRFPDGETYVRLATAPAHRDVVLACGLEHPDDRSTGIYFAAVTARELGAHSVGLVAPYLSYMRQDTRFHDGEAISSRAFAGWLSSAIGWLATIDPHLHRFASLDQIYSVPTAVATSITAIAQWIAGNIDRPLVVGPDAESVQWAAAIAGQAGCPYVVLDKTRRGDRDVEIRAPDLGRWRHCTPVLVDDVISTARTMAAACGRLHEAGIAAPVCVGVHALFAGDALRVLEAAGTARIVTCNSIPHATNAIDVLPAVAAAARGLLERVAGDR